MLIKKLICLLFVFLFTNLFLNGCEKSEENAAIIPEVALEGQLLQAATKKTNQTHYELTNSEFAEYVNYNYEGKCMYIAGLKPFAEFGTTNEGSVALNLEENILIFGMTKCNDTGTGSIDGPHVYFKMDMETGEILEKKFSPAPDYVLFAAEDLEEHEGEIISLSDERLLEIGRFFAMLIAEIEADFVASLEDN
ncbi:MAG: hypothetical protein GX197_05785 [Firmicutes bacterium]|nr:hypothetical protein [Bacillota bacterium]